MKIRITDKEIREYLDIETTEFPKFISPLIIDIRIINGYIPHGQGNSEAKRQDLRRA